MKTHDNLEAARAAQDAFLRAVKAAYEAHHPGSVVVCLLTYYASDDGGVLTEPNAQAIGASSHAPLLGKLAYETYTLPAVQAAFGLVPDGLSPHAATTGKP